MELVGGRGKRRKGGSSGGGGVVVSDEVEDGEGEVGVADHIEEEEEVEEVGLEGDGFGDGGGDEYEVKMEDGHVGHAHSPS